MVTERAHDTLGKSSQFIMEEDELDIQSLFERYVQDIYRLCLRVLGDPDEAADATQEIFMRALNARRSYDPKLARPRTWLGSIMGNYLRDLHRRRRVRQF